MATKQVQEQEMMNEQVQEQEQAQAVTEREVEVIDRGVELPLTIELVKSKDGRVYHNFKIKLAVFGREIVVDMRPKADDRNAYALADAICDIIGGRVAPLRCMENVMKDSSGKNMKYMTYLLVAEDPDSGMELSVALRPQGDSSKRLLESCYKQQIRKREMAEQF